VPDLSQRMAVEKLELLDSYADLIVEEEIETDIYKELGKLRSRNGRIPHVVEEFMKRSPSSSSRQESEWSSPERDSDSELSPAQAQLTQYGFGLRPKESPRPGLNDLWPWNPDLSTRYNQDMQREMEEKFMLQLATTLSQRIPIQF